MTFYQDLRPVPDPMPTQRGASPILVIGRVVYFFGLSYLFFASIELVSTAFRMCGEGLAGQLLKD